MWTSQQFIYLGQVKYLNDDNDDETKNKSYSPIGTLQNLMLH